ncbi:DUF2795 domain-containing protein [Hamadaea tsunoensis]|uniref:DUF2795 domain-containing protein n=1 Tax=Hamadaea tsunoensis TaxID=53368 RepID=UPI00047F6463|nr:DUF2795 domain-containing protein [Hamadaea tsunoensis]
MDRGNSKHSPRLDDEMAHETQGYTQGAGSGSRAEDWRAPEPPADGEPEPAAILDQDEDGLSRLGRFVPRTCLPGSPARLRTGAERLRAPDDVLEQLDRLDPGRTYTTIAEMWQELSTAQ